MSETEAAQLYCRLEGYLREGQLTDEQIEAAFEAYASVPELPVPTLLWRELMFRHLTRT